MRVVIDTNVLVSALLLPESKPRQALDAVINRGTLLLSFETLAEIYEVLSRKQFRRYIDDDDVRNFIAVLTRESEWVDVDTRITACRDPGDNKFLELAVTGKADYLISGDQDLLTLHPFRSITILTPHVFLETIVR